MHILIVSVTKIPVYAYGGTERVIWDLGKSLVQLGHKVSYLVPEGSHCDFAQIIPIKEGMTWQAQIPPDVGIAHFQFLPKETLTTPHLVTEHGNALTPIEFPLNTNFISRNQAQRYGSSTFVCNGLDWSAYGAVDFTRTRNYYHFLGKGAWRVKNLQGAIDVAQKAHVPLEVLGADRLNIKRGFRYTWSRKIHFHGMVGGQQKFDLLSGSKGLIFPVRWHEPFGLAVIESLYFGCPVFATPYGAIPEIVGEAFGVLSNSLSALADAVAHHKFDARACHQHVCDNFNALTMARGYVQLYERTLSGETLHTTPPKTVEPNRSLVWLR